MKLSDLREFADALRAKFQLPNNASAEDQLKEPVADLLKAAGVDYGLTIETLNEEHLSEHKVRPDMGVYVGGLICGYIELKAPGKGADAPRLRGKHDREQWQKLKSLPNLIYTDGREWALYRSGERQEGQPLIKLAGDPTHDGNTAVNANDAASFERLLRDFLTWQPIIPHRPTPLAKYIAPLTRFLRSEIEVALQKSDSAVSLLASEWRQFFFPEADDAQFADAYAQTVTYAMLLARLSGATDLSPDEAASTLDQNNGLLARALELLGQDGARSELNVGFEQLQRSFEALDPHEFLKSEPDLWLYFYEDFLAAYDEELRRKFGVYYTPREVVELQVRLASELLETRFGKHLGFADDGVVFLDPAVGTGTYPVAAIKDGLERVRARYGEGAVAAHARQMARNMHGFEILVGPYAVAHLRLGQMLEAVINEGKAANEPHERLGNRLGVYLADTLASPNVTPPGGLNLTHQTLTEEHEAARRVKNTGDVLVCLGNPPYDRETKDEPEDTPRRKGGWVRYGDEPEGGADDENQAEKPILRDFTDPVSKMGHGVHAKNLYNDYVYFWRWALWRLFEQQECGGIVTFITASSYLSGPGFVGMRRVMRETFDELWILDLGGDNLGARKTPNIFNIQTPVAIAVGIRGSKRNAEVPAKAHFARIEADTRNAKLARLAGLNGLADIDWKECADDWHLSFRPSGTGFYFTLPCLDDLFPWLQSGVKFTRTWPIGEDRDLLGKRFELLINTEPEERRALFKETSDRKIVWQPKDKSLPSIYSMTSLSPSPPVTPYAHRFLSRNFAINDPRFCDRISPALQGTISNYQIFFSTLMTAQLGSGPALGVSALVPDLHYFRGSFGGKDIIPLYRDAAATMPNVTEGLLEHLSGAFNTDVAVEDLAAYVYAVLGGQSYTRQFCKELDTPGPRVPVTKNSDLFLKGVTLGRRLIWLHTYAERFGGDDRGSQVPKGAATTVKGVPTDEAGYPNAFSYDETTKLISVGAGRFGPVAPEVWEFEVSGLKVVQSWLGYRMKDRKGRKSSPLDDIRPESWTAAMSDEFLELLWVLEATLDMEPELEKLLDQVVA
ncbi:MAG: type ISP restriction/modification enzyme, partial [Candidatus Puniceispirillaceae bacterium]